MKNMKSIISFYKEKTDEYFKLSLFEEILRKMGINYSLSEPIEKMELEDHSTYWNARIIEYPKGEYMKMYKAHERDKYPNMKKENDMIQFFLDHRKEILDWTKTFYFFVEAYNNYIDGIKDICIKANMPANNKTIAEVFKKKWKTLSDVQKENNAVVYIGIIKTIVSQLFSCATYEITIEKRDW